MNKDRPIAWPILALGTLGLALVLACNSAAPTTAPTAVPTTSSKLDTLPSKLDPGAKPLSEVAQARASNEKAIPDADSMSDALALVEDVLLDPKTMSDALALVEDVLSDPETMSDALALMEDVLPDSETVSDAPALFQDASPASDPVTALPSKYDAFGFALNLDQGAEFRTADGSVDSQGALSFALGDVNTILTWVSAQGSTPLALVSGTYDILRNIQTSIHFESINDGEISASGQPGVYLGFKSSDDSGSSLGGGLIGAWACADAGTAFTLTMTAADASTLQIRFDRLLESFTCVA